MLGLFCFQKNISVEIKSFYSLNKLFAFPSPMRSAMLDLLRLKQKIDTTDRNMLLLRSAQLTRAGLEGTKEGRKFNVHIQSKLL